MKNEHNKNLDRRDFLKVLGGAAAVTSATLLPGCKNKQESAYTATTDIPTDQMTYRINPSTQDRVSLLGYGCMRWPTVSNNSARDSSDDIDQETVNKLVDVAIAHGVNYFDTSPAYCKGRSERATGIALSRYPRDKYFIATKLSNFAPSTWSREASIAMYHNSFKELQVNYIDYLLLHGVGMGNGLQEFNARYIDNGVLDFLLAERQAGRIRNLGFSYHGDIKVFDYLLSRQDEFKWDFVQIQLNYVDWKHAKEVNERNTNAEYLYGELSKRGIPAIIMEPLLGGRLSNVHDHIAAKLKQRKPESSVASWAFRFAGSFPGVLTVLSGMTYMEHHNWGDHWINDGYTANPDDKNNPKPYRFDSHDDMMGISWYQSAQLFTGNRLTAGVDYYRFGGKAQNRYVEGERNGEREHIVDKVQHEIAGYIDFRQDISHWLTLDAGIRIDHHSHIGTEWIPQAGLSFHLPGSIELKASAGKGFRYPTIREMYMFPPKNPDLRPESMWNYELAFAQRLLDGRLSYGINVFYIDGKNLIVAVPRAGATPLNMNTGKIDNTGVEAEAAYRIHPHWSVETNYSYLHMDNPVLGAPEHKFYAGAMFSKNRWTVSTGLQYVANLYTDVDHVQTEDFVLWNINGSFKVTEWFDIWARGENLLAQRYEINAGYPMPKATIMAGINVKF